MLQTKVIDNAKHKNINRNLTNIIEKTQNMSVGYKETDEPQTLNKIMFIGLAVISVVLFYLSISSLML